MVTRAILIISLLVSATSGFFFKTPRSECSGDSQCPTFGRTECLKRELLIFCTESRPYTVSGKCLQRRNLFCDVNNALNPGKRPENCRYTECAHCLSSVDCWNGYDCIDYSCQRRQTRTFQGCNYAMPDFCNREVFAPPRPLRPQPPRQPRTRCFCVI